MKPFTFCVAHTSKFKKGHKISCLIIFFAGNYTISMVMGSQVSFDLEFQSVFATGRTIKFLILSYRHRHQDTFYWPRTIMTLCVQIPLCHIIPVSPGFHARATCGHEFLLSIMNASGTFCLYNTYVFNETLCLIGIKRSTISELNGQ